VSFITGVGLTPFGRHEGSSSLDLMSKAAQSALDDAGLELRRTREAGGGLRQGFVWVGDTILELIEAPDDDQAAPAAFWGLVVVVEDIDRPAAIAGDALGQVRDAVQPGRRIATVRESAGIGLPLALMTPHVKAAR
jgi:acetyl-CoA acetyltransferase